MSNVSSAEDTIINYNILSDGLGNRKNVPQVKHSVWNGRITRVISRINELINETLDSDLNKPIICLHEVSRNCADIFQPLFLEHGYTMTYRGHGSTFNDFMGSAIFMPNHLKILKIKTERIANRIEYFPADNYESPDLTWSEWAYSLWEQKEPSKSSSLIARAKWNVAILIQYQNAFNDFSIVRTIVAYHMPCVFWNPDVMYLHTDALHNFVEEHSMYKDVNTPTIIATDLNSVPTDGSYINMIENGYTNVYFHYNKEHPKYTCKGAHNNNAVFEAAIDHTFIMSSSDETILSEVMDAKKIEPSDSFILPDEDEPSDHLPIIVTVRHTSS